MSSTANQLVSASATSPFLSEPDAARILGYSAKRLADLRREGVVPRDTYIQKFRGGRVCYRIKALLRWFAGPVEDL